MITPAYAQTMARYNRWQNRSLYLAADGLGDAARRQDRGAFFQSIHGTLSHLLFADRIWMHRFAGLPKPVIASMADTARLYDDWAELAAERVDFDAVMIGWADGLDAAWLDGNLTWHSGVLARDVAKPKALLVTHMFNHGTHHRGQVHAMLTAAGAKPEDTDLCFMPE